MDSELSGGKIEYTLDDVELSDYPSFIGLAMIKYTFKKQLRKERVNLSSQFQVTVHHCKEVKAVGT